MADKLTRCIANNLHLYGAVLAPHRLFGAIDAGLWTCTGNVPPYYSNAITVLSCDAEAQMRAIGALARTLGRPFAVKDSFAALDLAPLGFRELFSAQWIWCDNPPVAASGDPWEKVATADDLAVWEAAWRENGSPAETHVFLPDLLADGSVSILASRKNGWIVAGCIANRSDDVIGFSNFFTASDRPAADLASAVATAAAIAPGRAIGGYEHGDSLAAMVALGFEPIGPLRVWLSPER